LTTLEAQVSAVRPDYDAFVKGLRINPQPPSESSPGVSKLEPTTERA